MTAQTLTFEIGVDLTPDEILSALHEHKSEIKSLLTSNLEYHSMRATCDGFDLDDIIKDEGKFILHYSYGWSAFYGCKDADDGDTEYGEIPIKYSDGIVVIVFFAKPDRYPNEEF
jgi:hypothetical protein